MGMYDTLTCDYNLPIPFGKDWEPASEYQTKDLDNLLNSYWIDEDGQLWCTEECTFEWGSTTLDDPVKLDYTGSLLFYGESPNFSDLNGWMEFDALFKDGVIQNVVRVKPKD